MYRSVIGIWVFGLLFALELKQLLSGETQSSFITVTLCGIAFIAMFLTAYFAFKKLIE